MPRFDLPPEYVYDIMLDDIAEGGRADRLLSDASRTAWPDATSDRPTEAFFLGRAAAEGLIAMTVLSVPCGQARDGRLMPAAEVLGRAKDWRIRLDLDWRMPMDTVLSGASIAAGRPLPGEFAAWDSDPVPLDRACQIFTAAIGGIDFGGDRSVMSVVTTHRMQIKYSRSLWWYTLRGMLQRCRSKCFYGKKDGIFCLQHGYPDDVEMFSASLDKLNVGSSDGGWPKRPFGLTSVKSLPLRMF